MDAEINLLEDRVRRAIARIGELGAENARLLGELRELRAELGRIGKESRRPRAADRREPALAAWSETLREAIRELRTP